MDKQQLSIDTFRNGFNCAQSVFSVLSEDLDIDRNTALKLATPFGAGIAYMQETCGAVSGALMAIGLKYGKGENGTNEDKERAYDMSKHFINEFTNCFGSVTCKELMEGHNMSTPEGMSRIMELDLFRVKCAVHVKTAVEIAGKIIGRDMA